LPDRWRIAGNRILIASTHWHIEMNKTFLGLAALALATTLQAQTPAAFELVHTAPVDTTLATPDLADPVTVWCQLFDSAKHSIDLGEFYADSAPGEPLEQVIAHLAAAGKRGVKIRFLMEAKGIAMSDPATIARLQKIPNLSFRTLDYSQVTGNGIIHAKYFVVDGKRAYVGSQNFDWRSLKHIHETGLRIDDAAMAAQIQAIFEQDWRAQQEIAEGKPVTRLNDHEVLPDDSQPAFLLSSPSAYNPPGVGDSEQELPRLLAQARHEVRIQVLTYGPLEYGSDHHRHFYPVIDDALRAAAQRGVKVKLMVSDWNTGTPEIAYLKSLAVLPNVEVRVVSLPPASSGFIPFARVIHTKTMEIDDAIAWVGTSNWEGGYMDNSRNLEVVLRDPALAKRLDDLHEQLWDSPYAAPVVLDKTYPKPHPGSA
jgi:phosphatidylserine/phosphatidylglycerophosphate/cardiolipin synthase-like enzyme